MAEYPM